MACERSIFHNYNALHIVCPQQRVEGLLVRTSQQRQALRHTTIHSVRYYVTSFNYHKRHKLHAVYTSVIGGAVTVSYTYTSKTTKVKLIRGDIATTTSPDVNVLLSNITF